MLSFVSGSTRDEISSFLLHFFLHMKCYHHKR